MAQTYYEILGVAEKATAAEIEAAFKARAREVHPDRVEPGSPYLRRVAAEAFKDLAEAKSVLLDPIKRQKYDLELAQRRGQEHAHAARGGARSYQSEPPPSPTRPHASQRTARASEGTPRPAERPERTRPWFWRQPNARVVSAAFVALGLGAIFVLGGLIWSGRTPPLWVVVTVIALALACWRQGMRPNANTEASGGGGFFILLAVGAVAIFLAYWFRPAPSDFGSSSSGTAMEASTAGVAPKAENAPVLTPRWPTTHRVTVEDPTIAEMNGRSTGAVRIWKSLRDGENYRTRLTDDALYLEAVKTQTKSVNAIVRCEFRRASAAPEWTGVCWERKGKEESSHKSLASITLSETRIEGSTSDIPTFTMTAVGNVQIGNAGALEPGAAAVSRGTGAPRTAQAELSGLTDPERQSVESACSYAKLMQGPAEYDRCLEKQIGALRAVPKPPDLSNLSDAERGSIESACSHARLMDGPAAYNQCLSRQLGLLRKERR